MNVVLGQLLPLAVGIAISPIPIIAVILMLLTPKAGGASTGFLLGWLVGIVAAVVLFMVIGSNTTLVTGGSTSTTGTVKIVLGVVLLVLSLRRWRKKPPEAQEAPLPKWMVGVDKVTPVKAIGLGFLLAAINPKNLALGIVAGMALATAGLPVGQEVAAIVVYTVIAACSVAIPVLWYAIARDSAAATLTSLKGWMIEHDNAVMAVVLLLLGVLLIGKGMSAS